MNFTQAMLKLIESRIKDKLFNKLPAGISYIPFMVISKEKNGIICILSSQGNKEAESYFSENKYELLKLIEDATYLYWEIKEYYFILQSGYVIFDDGFHDIYAYHEINGCEMNLDSYWSYESKYVKELSSNDLENYDFDDKCFDFQKELPKRRIWTWLYRENNPYCKKDEDYTCRGDIELKEEDAWNTEHKKRSMK